MKRLIHYALNQPLFILLGTLLFVMAGVFAFKNLSVEAFPDVTDTQVTVITLFPGRAAEETEKQVTIPLEVVLAGLPNAVRMFSHTQFGLSFIILTFDDRANGYFARTQVTERLREAQLPAGVTPQLAPMSTPIGEVYRYRLKAEAYDSRELRTLQDWVVMRQLKLVPGVAEVVTLGGLVKQYEVNPDLAKLRDYKVTLQQVFTALERGNANAGGSYLEQGRQQYLIRGIGLLRSADDIGNIVVAERNGVPVLVKHVAEVNVGAVPRQGIVGQDDDDDVVTGIVLMRKGENPSQVLTGVKQKIDMINTAMLPKGVEVVAFYDRTWLIDRTLKTVFTNLTEGALLVTLVLVLFLGNLRAAAIVAVVIPLSLLATFIGLTFVGIPANLLSLGAMDFGIIVDGAVILVEHLFHRLSPREGGIDHEDCDGPDADAGLPIAERVFRAAREVARPTLYSLLIIIAAYLPIFSLQRVEGRIFSPLANTVASALVGALLVSFTLVPVLTAIALRRPRVQRDSPLLVWARRIYEPSLRFAMVHRAPVLVLALGALAAAVTLAPRLGSEFLPELNEGALYVTFALPGNMSLTRGRLLTPRIKQLLARTPEVAAQLTQLGRPEDGTDPTLPSNLEVFVKLAPPDQWRKDKPTLDDLIAEMTQNLREIPGLEYNFSQPIRDNVAENISGQFGQVAVKIYGDDLETLQRTAEAALDAIQTVPGAADVGIVKSGQSPQLAVKLDRRALARFDLDLDDVQDYVETAMGGHVASELWEGERRFDVTVRLPVATREDVGAIRNVMLPIKSGALVPLSAIADVSMGTGRAAITRENGRRYIGIRMNVRARDLGSFVAEAREKVAAAAPLPPGYQLTWGGEFENQQRAMARLRLVIPLALLVTFLLLFSAFSSVFDAAMILLNVPLALIGGVLALAVAHMPLSVAAAVGFIALLGQAVLNGVLVVASIRRRIDAGDPLRDAVIEGTIDRLRAVLITALLASLGLLPAALSHAIGSETQRPIALVVVGGTISAALLTLIVLPISYHGACVIRERLAARRRPPAVGSAG